MATKWNFLSEETQAELDATPFGKPCSGCQEVLETEGDFARHFILFTNAYKNLGYCPVKGPGSLSFCPSDLTE